MSVTLSIIIVSYNCKDYLADTVESIINTGLLGYELILVENGNDGGVDNIRGRYSNIVPIYNDSNAGFASANNLGFNQSKGSYVLLLNPDTIVLPQTIRPMLRFMEENNECGICGPRVLNGAGKHTTNPCFALSPLRIVSDNIFKRLLRVRKELPKPDHSMMADFVHGSCMLIRREVYKALGGLDESLFMYCEEFEFSSRARALGWQTYYVSDAVVVHIGEGASSNALQWVFPLRWLSALKVYGRYRGKVWMLFLRLAGLLNLAVDTLSCCLYKFKGNDGNVFDKLHALSITLLVLILPVNWGCKLIAMPNRKL